jgi:hypothetical protein
MNWLMMWAWVVPFPPQPDIQLEIFQNQSNGVVFFAPHENEFVLHTTLVNYVSMHEGTYLVLRQNGLRHLTLRLGSYRFEVDPNRLFTPRGIRNNIRALNPQFPEGLIPEATALTLQVTEFLLRHLREGDVRVWVAIHNNLDGFEGDGRWGRGTVSIWRYLEKMSQGAGFLADLHAGAGDEDDLFWTTTREDFEALSLAGHHVVLQSPSVAVEEQEDDGSLSVYAAMQGIRYFNCEAQHGPPHPLEQERMFWELCLLLELPLPEVTEAAISGSVTLP